MGVEPASVRPYVRMCVNTFKGTHFYILFMNISAISRPIATKHCLKQHWGGGKAAFGFGPDRIKTLVTMATDSSHSVLMVKIF